MKKGILVVGSVAYDSVETPRGRRERVLGGSATYFSVCAGLFSPVSLVAVVGEDFGAEDRRFLEGRGIGLEGMASEPGKTFHWRGSYSGSMNEARTLETQLNVFERFRPRLPEAYRRLPVLFLANIDPELQLGVLEQMERPRLVVCDTMNFWIEGKRGPLLDLLRRVDVLLVNENEARQLSGEGSVVRAARRIREELGPGRVVVKRGEYGVLGCGPEGYFSAPAFPVEEVCDPTGAGDSFAGGFVGYLAGCERPGDSDFRRAAACGTVTASFTVEDFSLDRLRRLERAEVDERLARYLETIRC